MLAYTYIEKGKFAILLVDRHPDLMQVGIVPLHQPLSMDEMTSAWFQS